MKKGNISSEHMEYKINFVWKKNMTVSFKG